MNNNRAFKGIWIPKEIWLNEDLSLQEKVFLVEISSLDNEQGCFASNDYFADFFKLSKNRCSEIIKSLEKKGLIKITYNYKKNSKCVENRIIKVFDLPIRYSESRQGYSESRQGYSESRQGYSEKCEDNNIINNITNNIVSVVNKDADNNFEKPYIKKYMQSIKPTASNWEIQQLISYEDDGIEGELIEIAIEQALLYNKPNLSYIKAILNNCIQQDILTVEKYKIAEEFRNNKKQGGSIQKNATTEVYVPKYTEDDFTRGF